MNNTLYWGCTISLYPDQMMIVAVCIQGSCLMVQEAPAIMSRNMSRYQTYKQLRREEMAQIFTARRFGSIKEYGSLMRTSVK